jgi:hypothetical protein
MENSTSMTELVTVNDNTTESNTTTVTVTEDVVTETIVVIDDTGDTVGGCDCPEADITYTTTTTQHVKHDVLYKEREFDETIHYVGGVGGISYAWKWNWGYYAEKIIWDNQHSNKVAGEASTSWIGYNW